MDSAKKQQIQANVSSKDPSIKLQELSGKSASLVKFRRVSRKATEYITCKDCHAIFKNQAESGTSGLQRHSLICKKAALTPRTTSGTQPLLSHSLRRKVPAAEKSRLVGKLARMSATDLRPFSLVEGHCSQQYSC